MSSALAIAGVTAVLRNLLNDGIINHELSSAVGDVTVTAKPPDLVSPGSNGSESPQLNIFMHQVTPNPGWSNGEWPSLDRSGRRRLSNPPLALDLHYLISAYGAEDLHTDILIGYAMQLLHETPVLKRKAINAALVPSPSVADGLPLALVALAQSGLADQFEQIKITPDYLSVENMSTLWSSIQTHYRPSAAYVATVVLIETTEPTTQALPVLRRGSNDEGVTVQPYLIPPVPTITSIRFPDNQPSSPMGRTITIKGTSLQGIDIEAIFTSNRLSHPLTVEPDAGGTDTEVPFTIPEEAAEWAAGLYTLQISVVRPGETEPRITNPLPFYLAPTMTLPATVSNPAAGTTLVELQASPLIRENQYVVLSVGDQLASAEPRTGDTADLEFNFSRLETGHYFAKLTVDGVDSWMISRTGPVPEFDPSQRIEVV